MGLRHLLTVLSLHRVLSWMPVTKSHQLKLRVHRRNVEVHANRKQKFWQEVAFGLAEKFDFSEISRVIDFGRYARGELGPPKPAGPGHDPCEEYVPGLTAKPWHDTAALGWVKALEAHAPAIQAELDAVLAQDAHSFAGDSALQTEVMGTGWSALRLQRMGKWNEENLARFPHTAQVLRDIGVPTAMRGVMFARQAPGSTVAEHSDGRNFVLTAHLGLRVPSGGKEACWMECGGERRAWEEAKVLVLDTSFRHSTANESDQDRHVLIIDFWHPDLTLAEQESLKLIYDLRYEYDRALLEAKA